MATRKQITVMEEDNASVSSASDAEEMVAAGKLVIEENKEAPYDEVLPLPA